MAKVDRVEIEALKIAVKQIVCAIPAGRATSYGAIARAVGYPDHSRMVGRIMASIESGEEVPAHRVVNSQGMLSARNAFGPGRMQRLLEAEGIRITNNCIKNWRTVFWDPLEEIRL